MEAVASHRTSQIRLVLQDVHGQHNISACLRSAEALGVQNVDILSLTPSSTRTFRPTSVACGIAHWLTVRQFTHLKPYQLFLQEQGYHLYGAMPTSQRSNLPLSSLGTKVWPRKQPIAVLFGNENDGIHPELQSITAGSFTIPTSGFVESMNVSVAAAITLHHLSCQARELLGPHYFLTRQQQTDLLNTWITRHFSHWQRLYQNTQKSGSSS